MEFIDYDRSVAVVENAKSYSLRCVTDGEVDFLFSDSNTKLQYAWVGRLRGDFGRKGEEFWYTWFSYSAKLLTQQFKDDLQEVIDVLRKSLLKNLTEMKSYCSEHLEGKINGDSCPTFGFMTETVAYKFYIRCFPYPGDYQFNIYAYSKAVLSV